MNLDQDTICYELLDRFADRECLPDGSEIPVRDRVYIRHLTEDLAGTTINSRLIGNCPFWDFRELTKHVFDDVHVLAIGKFGPIAGVYLVDYVLRYSAFISDTYQHKPKEFRTFIRKTQCFATDSRWRGKSLAERLAGFEASAKLDKRTEHINWHDQRKLKEKQQQCLDVLAGANLSKLSPELKEEIENLVADDIPFIFRKTKRESHTPRLRCSGGCGAIVDVSFNNFIRHIAENSLPTCARNGCRTYK